MSIEKQAALNSALQFLNKLLQICSVTSEYINVRKQMPWPGLQSDNVLLLEETVKFPVTRATDVGVISGPQTNVGCVVVLFSTPPPLEAADSNERSVQEEES